MATRKKTPPREEPAADELLGMAWWNGLSDRARALWLQRVGTAVAADAWALFKTDPGIAFEIGFQEGRELAAAAADDSSLGDKGLALYRLPAGKTRH
jgi:hypothetical protein